MDPNTSTREEYTQMYLSLPPPESPPALKHMFTHLQKIVGLLAHHPAMDPNIIQTYMTPAASKNKVYFMWDYFGRTFSMLLSGDDPQEIIGRTTFAKILIEDKTGQLDSMVRDDGPPIEFGEEIENEVKVLCEGLSA